MMILSTNMQKYEKNKNIWERTPLHSKCNKTNLELKSKVDSSDIFSLALDENCDVHNTGNCVLW